MQNEKVYKKGSFVFIENDENSSSVFLVKKGRVSHICSSAILSAALKDAGEGDFFGFISSLSGRPRLSSAVAVEDSTVVQIETNQFFMMLRGNTGIAMKIMNSYSHALKHYDSVLLDIKPINLIYPNNLSLMRLGEFYKDKGVIILAVYIFNRYIQLFPDSENISEVKKILADIEKNSVHESCMENEKGELIYRDGTVIFCEHEPGDFLYFIKEGKVKIMKQSGERDMLIAVLRENEIFGELAILTNSPRSATALSFGGTILTPVDISMFRDMLKESPELVEKIMTSISQRLWFNHIRLGQMSYKNPVTRLFSFLESKLLEDNVSFSRKLPYQFQFGLDELISMNELSPENDRDAIDELVNNQYLSFNFGTITVANPNHFSSVVQMYKQRDHYPVRKSDIYRREVLSGFNAGDPINGYIHDQGSDETMPGVEESHGFIEDEIAGTIPELNNDDSSKRVDAVIRLGNLGEKARSAVPLLRERMGDNVKIIRKNAARSIIRILPPGESFKLLSDALTEKSQEIRSSAVAGLGELNIADRRLIVDLIIKTLKDQSPVVRSSAARSIGTFGVDAEHAAPALIKLLFDSDSSVRILSVNSLERIIWTDVYMQEVINAVKTVSKNDNDKFVKNSAREVLIKLNRRKKAIK
jgi:CRP-like cAMP-binding protein